MNNVPNLRFQEFQEEWEYMNGDEAFKQISNKKHQQLLETTLNKGEASAIALAMELENVLLVVDDLKARKKAEQLGIEFIGTLGVLFQMKQVGLLSALKPYFEQLHFFGFRITPAIMEVLLRESGEVL